MHEDEKQKPKSENRKSKTGSSGTRYFAMISRQKLSVLGIFWLAGVLAGLASLVMYNYAETWIWGNRFSMHGYYPSVAERAMSSGLDAWIGALVLGILYLGAGIMAGRVGFLEGITLERKRRAMFGVSLFSLHPLLLTAVIYLLLASRHPVDSFFGEHDVIGYLLGAIMVLLLFTRFLFLGYAFRLVSGIVPRLKMRTMLLGILGYGTLAGLFGAGFYAVVLTTSDGYSAHWPALELLRDQWMLTGLLGKIAVLDGPGLSFILWYWLMYPNGFTREGKVA